jgi:hypothetical protein
MPNPYIQVALTYIRRTCRIVTVFVWLALGLLVIACISAFFFGLCRGKHEFSLDLVRLPLGVLLSAASSVVHDARISLVLALLLSLAAAVHIREQFVNSRARLLPRFARVHVTIGAVVIFCIAVLLPVGLASLAGCDRFGFWAIAVFISGILLWTGSFRWMGWLAAVVLYFCIGASSDDGVVWINHGFKGLISGQAVCTATLLLGLGALLILLAWRRLIGLHEDMLGYGRPSQTGGKVNPPVGIQGRGRLARFLQVLKGLNEEKEVSRILRHARRSSTSSWSRTCRWQVGMATGRSLWFFALGTILAADFLFWSFSNYSRWEWDPAALLSFTSLPWLILMPTVSLGQLYQRMQVIGHELLMPVTRKAYFRELGLAALLAQFQLWSAAAVATGLWWLVAARQAVPIATIIGILAFSALLQVTLFAAALWLARYPLLFPGLLVLLAVGFVPIIAAATGASAWFAERPYAAWSAAVAAFAALDLILTWGAYRCWLAADFNS